MQDNLATATATATDAAKKDAPLMTNTWVNKLIIGTLLSIISFFAVNTYTRLTYIEEGLVAVKLELAKMRILEQDDIKRLCQIEIYKYMEAHKGVTNAAPPHP